MTQIVSGSVPGWSQSVIPVYCPLDYNQVRRTGNPQTQAVGGAQNEDMLGTVRWENDPYTPLGRRGFVFVNVNSSDNTTPAVGNIFVFSDLYNYTVTAKQSVTGASRMRVAGVQAINYGSSVAIAGNNIWIQFYGYHAGVLVDNSTFAMGYQIVLSGTDATGTLVANGTAPPYPVVGTALAAATGSNPYYVAAQLHCGQFGG